MFPYHIVLRFADECEEQSCVGVWFIKGAWFIKVQINIRGL